MRKVKLIRVGSADWSEFAGWRYGDHLRRRRFWRVGLSATVAVGSVSAVGAGLIGAGTAVSLIGGHFAADMMYRQPHLIGRKPVCLVPDEAGTRVTMRRNHLRHLELWPHGASWELFARTDAGPVRLRHGAAMSALSYSLPRINYYGGTTASVREGLAIIKDAGGPESLVKSAAVRQWRRSKSADKHSVVGLPQAVRMALEMALEEEVERADLVAELATLRRDWAKAELISAARPWT